MMDENECAKCMMVIQSDEQFVVCDACRSPFHATNSCSILSTTEYRALALKQRMVIFFCKDCRDIFKQTPVLLKKITTLQNEILNLNDEVKDLKQEVKNLNQKVKDLNEENRSIKTQLETSNNSNNAADRSNDGNSLSIIIQEIHQRQIRAANVIVCNIQESKEKNRLDRARDDTENVKKILGKLSEHVTVNKTFRLGKYSDNKNRPVKVTLSSTEEVLHVLRNKREITLPGIKVFADQTKMQQQYYLEVKNKLNVLLGQGETNKSIKYINGIPTIVELRQKN